MRAQPQRSLVLGLGIGGETAPRVKISERGARLGPVGIEALGSDELSRRALERFAIGGRLARARNCGEQRGGAHAHQAAWREPWPWQASQPTLSGAQLHVSTTARPR